MDKAVLNKPTLFCVYGIPGSGKSYVARNLSQSTKAAHVSADRIRSQLFESPRYTPQENAIVMHLMKYMTEEFLTGGLSVIFDANVLRQSQRQILRDLAKKHGAEFVFIWLQIDPDSSFARTQKRDKRTLDDRYSQGHTRQSFSTYVSRMEHPHDEEFLVVSGKHSYNTQKNTILNYLYRKGLITSQIVQNQVARPDLTNLIPHNITPLDGNLDARNISVQ